VAPTTNRSPRKAGGQRTTPVTPTPPAAGSTPVAPPSTPREAPDVAKRIAKIAEGPRSSPKQALDDLDTYLTGLRQSKRGIWTREGNLTKPKGKAWYQATIVNKKGVRRQLVRVWNGQAFEWKRL
jgi:hypothetical protein